MSERTIDAPPIIDCASVLRDLLASASEAIEVRLEDLAVELKVIRDWVDGLDDRISDIAVGRS